MCKIPTSAYHVLMPITAPVLRIVSVTVFIHIVCPGVVEVSSLSHDLLCVCLYLVAQNENLYIFILFIPIQNLGSIK